MASISTSLFHTPIGTTISFSSTIIATYGNVGNVFALLQTQISKNLFEPYHNIDSLSKQYPGRVKVLDDLVQIEGPVLISSGKGATFVPMLISGVLTAAIAFIGYKVIDVALNKLGYKDPKDPLSTLQKRVVILTSALVFIGCCAIFFKRIPTEPGVHLLDWSFKKIN